MISELTHEMIKDCVDYMNDLEEYRVQAMKDFLEYTRKLDQAKAKLEELKKEQVA